MIPAKGTVLRVVYPLHAVTCGLLSGSLMP